MKVLVTGGAGFIGEAVVKKLLAKNSEVRVLDLKRPALDNGIDVVQADILDEIAVRKALEGCDSAIHLSAVMGVENTENNPLRTLEVNIQGTRNLLKGCVAEGVSKVVFASSSEVYGEPDEIPIKEDCPRKPLSVYGVSKLASEEYVKAFGKEHDIDYCVVRPFNVYGPGQRDDFVVPAFVCGALRDGSVRVFGTGSQIRAFLHVDDAANGVVASLLAARAGGLWLNLGNPSEPISINELAKRVSIQCGKMTTVEYISLEESYRNGREIMARIPDISQARKLLNWEPQISLKQGLDGVIRYWRQRLNDVRER